jgi:hypothetical protein
MISVFAPGTLLSTFFCLVGWAYLTYANGRDLRFAFMMSCFCISLAYGMAFYQYVIIFYVVKTPQDDRAMWALFIRMLLQGTGVLIFIYNYRYSIRR